MRPGRQWGEARFIVLLILPGIVQAGWFIAANLSTATYVNDLFVVAGYAQGFSHDLAEGMGMPRWLGQLLGGTGAPVFVFYPPLAFYLSSVFALPGRIDPHGFVQVGLSMGAAIAFASLSAYAWVKRRVPAHTACLFALLLSLMPCQFASMHLRISLAQLWAQGFFMLALIAGERWRIYRGLKDLAAFSVTLACILMTHPPSALLFWPFLLLYAAGAAGLKADQDKKVMAGAAAAALLAIGLCSIYLLPLLTNIESIRTEAYASYIIDYRALFLPPPDVLLFFMPEIFLEALPFFILAAASLLVSPTLRNTLRLSPLFLSVLLLLPVSIPLWPHLLFLHGPFRLLTLYLVLCPLIILPLARLKPLAQILVMSIALLPGWWVAIEDYSLRREISHSATARHMTELNEAVHSTALEYQTRWMPAQLSPAKFADYATMPRAAISEGSVQVKKWQDESIRLQVVTPSPAVLRIKQHFFPGWQALADGRRPVPLAPDEEGLMRMTLPPGQYDVELTFSALPGATAGAVLSFLSLAAALVLWTMGDRVAKGA